MKADPADYICGATSAHPWETLKELRPRSLATKSCLSALEEQRKELHARSSGNDDLNPILLVPKDSAPDATLDTFRDNDQLLTAIAYAEYAKDEYMAAKRQEGSIPPFLASVLGPIGGTALALGALGINPTAVTSLGAAGGTIAGIGTVVQSKDREKIYVTGAEGVQCLLNNMQPYTYIDREELRKLYKALKILASERVLVSTLTAAAQAEAQPKDCLAQEKDPKKKNRGKLLEAAQAASKAAATTDSIGNTFLRTAHDSPATIVYVVDKINNSVSESIISTEPDIQTLAKNLQTTITTEEQNITASAQSVPNAKTSTKDAAASTPPPAAAAAAPAAVPSPAEAPIDVGAPPSLPTDPEFPVPYDVSDRVRLRTVDAQLSAALIDMATTGGQILDIVGDNIKPPKNDACPILAKKSGEPKVLTFVPDGDIIVKNGSHTDLTVAGAQNPYVRPLFGQTEPTITATLKENNVLEVAATKDAKYGEYPFFVGDGPTGKPVNVVILYSQSACDGAAGPGGKPPAPPKPAPKRGAKPGATPTTGATGGYGSPPGNGADAEQPHAAATPSASAQDDSQPTNIFAAKDKGAIDYSNPYGY